MRAYAITHRSAHINQCWDCALFASLKHERTRAAHHSIHNSFCYEGEHNDVLIEQTEALHKMLATRPFLVRRHPHSVFTYNRRLACLEKVIIRFTNVSSIVVTARTALNWLFKQVWLYKSRMDSALNALNVFWKTLFVLSVLSGRCELIICDMRVHSVVSHTSLLRYTCPGSKVLQHSLHKTTLVRS